MIFQTQIINDNLIIKTINPGLEDVSEQDVMITIREIIINKQCTHLNLFKHQLSSENVSYIASALSSDMSLKCLELGQCSVGDAGVECLTQYLPVDSCLEHLDLYGNSITDIGVQYLAEMLKNHPFLSRLKLSYNKISNSGV